MGGKRTRTGKQIYFCLAGLILFGLAGCAFLKTLQERDEARESLLRGRRLFAQGDYEGSLKENQRALSLAANQAPADEALFQMALIYAHADNPKKDQRQAVALFRRVIHEHSRTPLAEQAKVWVGVLQMSERLSQTNEKLSQTNEKLSQTNEKLSRIIEKSKQVDIEIEEKKRGKER
jgi:tetratricopeptide (TPR) repeat protein